MSFSQLFKCYIKFVSSIIRSVFNSVMDEPRNMLICFFTSYCLLGVFLPYRKMYMSDAAPMLHTFDF